jgi:DNA-binding transcriptional MerR regulator
VSATGPAVERAERGERPLRIGEVAAAAGVSTRTLRYYQELGLISPSGHTPGGARRYGPADVERLTRILELRDLLGFNLVEIAEILAAEDRLAGLRAEWWGAELSGGELSGGEPPGPKRREEILEEAAELNHRLQANVHGKLERLGGFLRELEARAGRYEEVAAELRAGAAGR